MGSAWGDKRSPGKRIERPGTGWGRSDPGSGRTPPGQECALILLAFLALPAFFAVGFVLMLWL